MTLTTGGALPDCATELDMAYPNEGEYSSLYSMPLLGAAHKQRQAGNLAQWDDMTTAEDHLLDGGFGSWMMEAVALHDRSLLTKLRQRGLRSDACGNVGTQNDLMSASGFAPIWVI